MTTKIWRGDAPAVAQVTHVTPANVQIGDIFVLTCNGKSISVTATAATAANVCTLMAAAIAASEIPEFGEFTASVASGVLVLTAATAGVPFTVTADSTDGSAVAVTVTTTTQGAASSGATNMFQEFRIPLTAAGGFVIFMAGDNTAGLTVGDSAATVEAAIETLAEVGAGNVAVVLTTDTNDSIYTCEFDGALAGTNIPELYVILASTKPVIRTTQAGSISQNEIQTITMDNSAAFSGSASGTTYTLTYAGQTTGTIDTNATIATVEAALEALSNIASVSVTRSGQNYVVEFTGVDGLANLPQMSASVYSGSASASITIEPTVTLAGSGAAVNEVQVITISGSPTGGTFTLTFDGQTTGTIAYNASAATVDAALEALSNIGVADVAVTGDAGGPWTVTFGTALAGTNVAEMTGDAAGLTGGDADSFTVSEITASAGPNHWDTAANWIPSGVPVNGDDVRFELGDVECFYGLSQSAVTLDSLHVGMMYRGKIGLPRVSDSDYIEYRTQALTIGITDLMIGWGEGAGPSRVDINTGSVATTIEIRGSGGSSESGVPAITWRGSHAGTDITVLDGDFGTCPWSDQTAVIDVLIQRGGQVALKHTALNEIVATNQSITAYDCTLSGGPLEL